MNYCSLEEAWGIPSTSSTSITSNGSNIHKEHKKKFQKNNPIYTPNLNYECDLNKSSENSNTKTLTGYQNKSNNQLGYPIIANNLRSNDSMLNKTNKNLDLYSFIKTLNLDEATKSILINKITNTIDSVKLESEHSSDIREDFGNRYYRPSYSENRNVDILFLILLGLFIIFILDRK